MSEPLIPRFGLGLRPIPPSMPSRDEQMFVRAAFGKPVDPVSEIVSLMNATPIFRGTVRVREDEHGVVHIEDGRDAHMMMSRETAAAFRFTIDTLEV